MLQAAIVTQHAKMDVTASTEANVQLAASACISLTALEKRDAGNTKGGDC
jgi:hypothetical protein